MDKKKPFFQFKYLRTKWKVFLEFRAIRCHWEMQAVIALCHFCENHGPRVMMTTQPMRSVPSASSSTYLLTGCKESLYSLPQLSANMEEVVLPLFYGDCSPDVYEDPEERCDACSSFGNVNQPCLLSNDHANKTSYVSTQIALKERVLDRVKNACLRSLSCEISAPQKVASMKSNSGNTSAMRIGMAHRRDTLEVQEEIERAVEEADGHVIFGDADNGYCFSLTFRLQDSKARGFLRLYSFIVVSNDLTYIINNNDYFLRALTAIKGRLQNLAALTFSKEMAYNGVDDAIRPEYASMAGKLPPGWFRPKDKHSRKVDIDTRRNLQTITGDDTIWNRLHRQMMWTLRTETLRCYDQVLEGVPTQDMLVMMEMEPADIVELDLAQPNQHEITLAQLVNLKIVARILFEQDESDLDLVIKQIITGGQVIVVT
uniref:UDENN FLCN/SMCR8-type domain-containing protein n=1 Tax=Heterorhabditis bacteriophora TaxID=37862 RepID=A0A1I7X9Z2_HETBA